MATLSLLRRGLALFVIRRSLGTGVGTALGAAIVYMPPFVALLAASEKVRRRRADASLVPIDWVVHEGAKLMLSLAAAGIGISRVLLLGTVSKGQGSLQLANRMALVVTVNCLSGSKTWRENNAPCDLMGRTGVDDVSGKGMARRSYVEPPGNRGRSFSGRT